MESASTIEFAQAARAVGRVARRRRLVAPSFRCPPRTVGVNRTVRRRPGSAGAVVAVRVKGRPIVAVLADMVEGAVVASGVTSPDSDQLRADLWDAVLAELRLDDRGCHLDRASDRPDDRTAEYPDDQPVVTGHVMGVAGELDPTTETPRPAAARRFVDDDRTARVA